MQTVAWMGCWWVMWYSEWLKTIEVGRKQISCYRHVEKTEKFSYPCKLVFNSSVDEWNTISCLSGSFLSGMVAIGPAIDPRPLGCCQDSLTISELLVCWSSSSVAYLAAQCKQGQTHPLSQSESERARGAAIGPKTSSVVFSKPWSWRQGCSVRTYAIIIQDVLFFVFFLLLMPSLNLLGRGPYGDQSAFDASRYIHKEYIRTLGRLPKLAEAEHPFSTKRLHPSHHFLLL